MSEPPGTSAASHSEQHGEQPVCPRHPDRRTGLRCARCDRPACPECLREAPVGYHCVDCLKRSGGRAGTPEPVTVAGARLRRSPLVVPAIVLANVVVYVLTAVQAGSAARNYASPLFTEFAMLPLPVAEGQWWRLVATGFLHLGMIHLALNMVALWVIGKDLELVLGRARFAAVYALALLGGSTAVFLFGELDSPVAGASGAVYGLMGGIAVAAFRLRVSLRPVLVVIAINIVFTVSIPGISLLGHLGGLLVGAVATGALVYAPRPRQAVWQSAALGVLLLLLVVLIITRTAQLGFLA